MGVGKGFKLALGAGIAGGIVGFLANSHEKKSKEKPASGKNNGSEKAAEAYLPSTRELQEYVDRIIEETSDYTDPIEAFEVEPEVISDDSRMAQRLLLTSCFAMVVYMYPEKDRNLAAVSEMLSSSFYAYSNMENKNPLDYMMEASDLWLKGEISKEPPILIDNDYSGRLLEDWCNTLRGLTPTPGERTYLGFVVEEYKSFKRLVTNQNVNTVIKTALFRVRRYGLENARIDL